MVLPSGRTSRVKSIVTFDGDLEEALRADVGHGLPGRRDRYQPRRHAGTPSRMPHVSRRFEATVVWMHTEAMQLDRPYLVKHTTQQVRANVTQLHHRVNINDLAKIPADTLELNEIGVVSLETHRPLFFDAYRKNRGTGAFILIDPVSNLTVAAGHDRRERACARIARESALSGVEFERSRLTAAERWERAGHRPATIWLTARTDVAYLLERELFDRGCMVHVLADDVESHFLPELAKISAAAGLITICTIASDEDGERDRARELVGPEQFVDIDPQSLSTKDVEAKDQIMSLLESRGFVRPDDRGIGGDGI